MIYFVFPRDEMMQQMNSPEFAEQVPAVIQFMFSHMEKFFLLFLVISFTAFIAAIGLLKRKNWARIIFIILMSLGILWNVGSLILQFTVFKSMQDLVGASAPPEFQTMETIMSVVSIIMVFAFCTFFGWIIMKLTSKPMVKEFSNNSVC